MAKTGYFDTNVDRGFYLRTHLEESGGVISVTGMKLWSGNYTGGWFPGGAVKVNGVEAIKMDFNSPATHSFYFGSVDTWADIVTLTGQALPVVSQKITGGKAVIDVDVTLFKDMDSPRPRLTGTYTIDIAAVLAKAFDGAIFGAVGPAVSDGTAYHRYRPIIHDGTGWKE